MLLAVMRECRNFFEISSESGDFELKSGAMAVKGKYATGQYVLISGSLFNDGVKRVELVAGGVISFIIDSDEYPMWKQPTGAHDAYMTGDRVTHGGERWVSLINANIWAPGSDTRWWEHIVDEPGSHATVDEIFNGTVYGLRVTRDFLALVDEVETFQKSPANAPSSFVSESVSGVHSWSKATDKNGAPMGWQAVFAAKLTPFRRMFTGVKI